MSESPSNKSQLEQRLADRLWQIGQEDPELRSVISKVILHLELILDIREHEKAQLSNAETPSPAGERLKHLREAAGLNQRQLARKTGVDPTSICKLESGQTQSLRQETLDRIRTVFPDF